MPGSFDERIMDRSINAYSDVVTEYSSTKLTIIDEEEIYLGDDSS